MFYLLIRETDLNKELLYIEKRVSVYIDQIFIFIGVLFV